MLTYYSINAVNSMGDPQSSKVSMQVGVKPCLMDYNVEDALMLAQLSNIFKLSCWKQ